MIIYKEDSEEEKVWKRRVNEIEMRKDHERGALELPLGIPERCKVEQPRAHLREVSYKLGSGGYPVGNGVTRIRYKNGHNKYEYHTGFAGPARKQHQINTGEDTGIDERTFRAMGGTTYLLG